jgi:multiple sugar transport system permease protein
MSRSLLRKSSSDSWSAYTLLAPFLAIYLIFQIYPLFQAAYSSLYDLDLLALGNRKYEGLSNYKEMFVDPVFWSSLKNTVLFVLYSTPSIVGVGLIAAVLLSRSGRLTGFLRTLFFCPYVLSVSVLTLIWGFLLNPQRGLISVFLGYFGVDPISWLTIPDLAMPSIVAATLWWTVGFNMVLFIAGLQDIDPSMYEAAHIDGANGLQQFFKLTLPNLVRTILLVTVLQVIASFQIFGQVYIMTRGGPGGRTRVLIQYIYESGFRDYRLGYASAMSILLFLLMLIVSYVQFRMSPKEAR